MKNFYPILLTFLLILQSCQNEAFEEFSQESENFTSSKEEINEKIFKKLEEKGNFVWSYLNDEDAWEAFQYANNLVSVAWNYNSENNLEKEKIIEFILTSEGKTKNDKDVILETNDNLKVLLAKIYKKETFIGLRHLIEAEVVEPAYQLFTKEEAVLASLDVKEVPQKLNTYTPKGTSHRTNNTISYFESFDNQSITNAWDYNITGRGITTAVIDGGLLYDDTVFGANGNHTGDNPYYRTVRKKGLYKFLWWNPFSGYDGNYVGGIQVPENHGTDMMKLIGAPRSNYTGAAFNANLISIRSSWGVWIDPLENNIAVAKAFEYLAKRNDVKVISMSQGSLLDWIWIKRAVRKCHERGKLIFAAGGTFYLPGVQQLLTTYTGLTLFPARMNEIYSCTGIKKLEETNNEPYWCDNCFGVSDFVFEFNEDGSSSVSTASTAGIATLIWSKQPSLTRQQVIEKMIQASDYPNQQHQFYGYGRVHMDSYLNNEGLVLD